MAPRLLEQPPAPSADPFVTKRSIRTLRGRRIDDERLAGHVADRHDSAFGTLYERYHQPLYRYCRSLLHDDGDAQDALQSTFTLALVALREGRRDAPLRPWLFRIAHNEAISLVRRRRVGDQELSEALLPTVPSAADEAAERARLALLVSDLTHLPDRQRGALLMRELSGLSHAEIAVALGTSAAAAKQAIFEARQALSEFAEGRAASCEEIRRRLSEHDGRMLRNRRLRSHLRDCSTCDAFSAAIGQRRSDLRAIAPALPLVASAGLIARIARGGGHQGPVGLAAAGGAAAGVAVKFGGAALISKSLAAIAAALMTVTGVAGFSSTPHSGGHAPQHVQQPQAPAVWHAVLRPAHSGSTPVHRSRPPAATHHSHVAHPSATARSRVGEKRSAKPVHTKPAYTPAPAHTKPAHTPAPAQQTEVAVTSTPTTQASGSSPAPTSQSVAAPGKSSAAPGHRGTSPSNSDSSNGASSSAPGHTRATPGHGGTPPGQGAAPPGQTTIAPGPTATAPERSDAAPGNSAAAPGHGGIPPGQLKK